MQKNCVKKIKNNILEIEKLMNVLKNKRPVFYSEADFQLELGRLIVEKYPNTKVRMEHCLKFDCNIHINILVLDDVLLHCLFPQFQWQKCLHKNPV